MVLTPFHTRMGWIALLATDRALVGMTLPQTSRDVALAKLQREFPFRGRVGGNSLTRRARTKLVRYFAGHAVDLTDLPFDDCSATAFQRRVWRLTRAIPYGTTRTYQELARAAGRPNAARAVGQCMARNPLPIVVPCHRVVGSRDDLRGFGGGVRMKRALLQMEGAL